MATVPIRVPNPAVALDATAVPPVRGGVARYLDQLVGPLAEQLVADSGTLHIICQQRDAQTYSDAAPDAVVVPLSTRFGRRAARLAWEQTGLPVLLRRLGVQVLHSPHYTMPTSSPVPVVVTLHDATFFSAPQAHLAVKRRFFRAWIRYSTRHAAVCLVPARTVADELIRVTHAPPALFEVAYHGVDRSVFHPPHPAEMKAFRELLDVSPTDQWIAFLGTLEPRKNVPALVRGYVNAFVGRPDPPILILAGADGWDAGVAAALRAVPQSLRVLRAGRLPDTALAALLGGSELSCYPSLGEGFGLPVLEAMACGGATLTTRRAPMPEIAGDAAAYTDVDSASIGRAMARLIEDSRARERLRLAGRRRADEFSWTNSATAHVRAYRRAAGAMARVTA